MKTFNKRIGFIISAQHLIPHGGIGQFAKGLIEMLDEYQIDIILDKAPASSEFVELLAGKDNVKLIYPPQPLSSQKHTKVHAFSETLNLERIINFRDSLMLALQTQIYDTIIINTPEALFSTYALGIQKFVQIVFYTHNENLVFKDASFAGVFNDSYDEIIGQSMRSDGITVGTQTPRNLDELVGIKSKAWLPMPIPERDLLTPSIIEKSGVLFIGRWEERKNPKEFLRLIEETGLPAKVMTNENGAKSFEAALSKLGVPYEIKASIIGKEKVDFIKSAKVFYMPSKSESYGFALMEAIGHTHSIVLEEYPWHKNFDPTFINVSAKKDVASLTKRLYNTPVHTANIDYVRSLDDQCKSIWVDFIESFNPKQSTSNSANITKHDEVLYADFISSLGRFASIEDVISVLSNRHKFTVSHSKEGTFLSKSGKTIQKSEGISFDDIF